MLLRLTNCRVPNKLLLMYSILTWCTWLNQDDMITRPDDHIIYGYICCNLNFEAAWLCITLVMLLYCAKPVHLRCLHCERDREIIMLWPINKSYHMCQIWSMYDIQSNNQFGSKTRTNLKTCMSSFSAKKTSWCQCHLEDSYKGAYHRRSGRIWGHSYTICSSSAIDNPPPTPTVNTYLLALSTNCHPEKWPVTMGKLCQASLKCKKCCTRLPETGSWQYCLVLL